MSVQFIVDAIFEYISNYQSPALIAMDSIYQILSPPMAISFFVFLLFLMWRRKYGTNSVIKNPPGPVGVRAFIRHLHLLRGSELLHLSLASMADKYGPTFMLRMGTRRTLVVSSWEVAKECYTTNDAVLAPRPGLLTVQFMANYYPMFGFSPYGLYWLRLRKRVLHEILSNRRLESLNDLRALEINTCIKELYDICTMQDNAPGPVLVDMKQWLGNLSFNLILRMTAGKRYFGATSARDNNESLRLQNAMAHLTSVVGRSALEDALPTLGWWYLQVNKKQAKNTAKEFDSIIQGWLEDHKKKKSSPEADGENDFIYMMMDILQDAKFSDFNADTDTITKATCLTIILGGLHTTSATLTWALSLLLNNPHTIKQAQNELDIHVGKDRCVKESDLKNLVYLQSIVKETLRLYSGGIGPRVATKDCTIDNYHVPMGTRLILNIWKIQRDPSIWSKPNEFCPERFLTKHTRVDVRGQNYELIPFGSGRRACSGTSLALRMVQLCLARVLHQFELSTQSGMPIDMIESLGIINIKGTPLEVLISPRLSFELYK